MFGNISHYHYVQNKGFINPATRDQIRWNNDLDKKTIEELIDFNPEDFFAYPTESKFELTTTYPGLLIGSGYAHPALYKPTDETDAGDFQLGFFFDHTTGLPVIPGTSIKGIIRDVFPKEIDGFDKVQAKITYINNILKENGVTFIVDENNFISIFFKREQVFFEAYLKEVKDNTSVIYFVDLGSKKSNGETKYDEQENIEKHLFAEDYITPHDEEDIFKEPTPIRFLKVSPGVTFTFQFKLINFMKSDLQRLPEGEEDSIVLSEESILKVFKQILLDFGIGAKRNVGYGQFK